MRECLFRGSDAEEVVSVSNVPPIVKFEALTKAEVAKWLKSHGICINTEYPEAVLFVILKVSYRKLK